MKSEVEEGIVDFATTEQQLDTRFLQEDTRDGVRILTITGERLISEADFSGFQHNLLSATQQKSHDRIVLNFEHITFVTGHTLDMFIAVQKAATERKSNLVLAAMQPHVRTVFKVTRLDSVFQIANDLEGAIAHLD